MVKILLSKILGERKITQAQLAKATRIRPSTINDLFHGNSNSINFNHLDLICAELDCDVCDILVRNNQVNYLVEKGKVEALSDILNVAVVNAEKTISEAQKKVDVLTKQLGEKQPAETLTRILGALYCRSCEKVCRLFPKRLKHLYFADGRKTAGRNVDEQHLLTFLRLYVIIMLQSYLTRRFGRLLGG